MADITLPVSFSSGAATAADDVNRNFYDPGATSTSLYDAINGRLDNANRQAGWDIRGDQIRNRSMFDAQMVGSTGNLDYTDMAFPDVSSDPGAFAPIPGAGGNFFLHRASMRVIILWQVVVATDLQGNSANNIVLRFYVDGSFQTNITRDVPPARFPAASPTDRLTYRDRVWSGHWTSNALADGWHSAHVAIFQQANVTRVRNRRIAVVRGR